MVKKISLHDIYDSVVSFHDDLFFFASFFFLFFNFNNLVPFFFKYFTIWSNEKYNFLFVFTKEKGINEILNFVFAASSIFKIHQRNYVR